MDASVNVSSSASVISIGSGTVIIDGFGQALGRSRSGARRDTRTDCADEEADAEDGGGRRQRKG
jgi:hypothetical protein